MPEQVNKTPCCIGLLAHVDAGRGEPHFNSHEKFEFLMAFLHFLGYIDFNLYFAAQSTLLLFSDTLPLYQPIDIR